MADSHKRKPVTFSLGPTPKRKRTEDLASLQGVPHTFIDDREIERLNGFKISDSDQPDEGSQSIDQQIRDIIAKPEHLPPHPSPLQEILIQAKYHSSNTDPRFIPIPLENQDTLKVSLVINLYDNGFSFDEQEVAYQYSRANQSVADTVNLGILPGQLDQILQRAERVIKDQPPNPQLQPGTPTGAPGTPGAPPPNPQLPGTPGAAPGVPPSPGGPAQPGSTTPPGGQTPVPGTPTPGGKPPTPIVFYDGGIILEVRDYRDGRGMIDDVSHVVKPLVFKMYLKPDMHSLQYHLDSLHSVHPRNKIFLEQGILNNVFSSLCLDPSTDVHRLANAMYFNAQKFNTNPKTKSLRKRKRIVPHREPIVDAMDVTTQPPAPFPPQGSGLLQGAQLLAPPAASQISISAAASSVAQEPEKPARFNSKLFNFLEQINHSSYSRETMQHQQQTRPPIPDKHVARRQYIPLPAKPLPKPKPAEQYPTVAGRFFFVPTPIPSPQMQQRPGMPPQPMPAPQPPATPPDFIVLEIKGSTPPPHEFYIAHLKLSNAAKPVSITLGGPSAAQAFLNQFRKLENAASPEQIKMMQQRAMQQMQQQARAGGPPPPGGGKQPPGPGGMPPGGPPGPGGPGGPGLITGAPPPNMQPGAQPPMAPGNYPPGTLPPGGPAKINVTVGGQPAPGMGRGQMMPGQGLPQHGQMPQNPQMQPGMQGQGQMMPGGVMPGPRPGGPMPGQPAPGVPKYTPQQQQQMLQMQKQQMKQQQANAAAQQAAGARPPGAMPPGVVGQPPMPQGQPGMVPQQGVPPPGVGRGGPPKIPINIQPSASVAQLQSHQYGKK